MHNFDVLSQVYPHEHLCGLVVTHVDNENIQIEIGGCRDSTDERDIDLTSAANIDITGSGAGGLDTGSVAANTLYAIHTIFDSNETNAVDGICSLSPTAPTMPATHDLFRHTGWILTDSTSDIIPFKQTGRLAERFMRYETEKGNTSALLAGKSTIWAILNLALFVPSTSTKVKLLYTYVPGTPGNCFGLRPLGSNVALGDGMACVIAQATTRGLIEVDTDSNRDIEYCIETGDTLELAVIGYHDIFAV